MTTPAIIDLIAASVLLGFAIAGARRGLFRTLAGLLIILLAMTGARMAAETAAEPAARFLAPVLEQRIQRRLDETLPRTPAEPGRMPETVEPGVEELLELLGVSGERLSVLAEAAREQIRDTGASILTAAALSAAESLLYGILYMLAFAVLTVLLHLAAKALDLVLKLPGLHGVNALGGFLAGLLEGALVLLVLTLLLRSLGAPLEGSHILRIYMTCLV